MIIRTWHLISKHDAHVPYDEVNLIWLNSIKDKESRISQNIHISFGQRVLSNSDPNIFQLLFDSVIFSYCNKDISTTFQKYITIMTDCSSRC